MTFLAKLGAILLKATEIITGIGPILSGAYPAAAGTVQVVSQDLAQIGGVIANVEAIGQVLGTAGSDKLRAAAPLVAQIVLQSSLLVNHSIDNPALFQQGSTKLADGMADILNSLKANISTTNKA